MIISDEIRRLADEMTLVRRELHRQPQLGFNETFANAVIQKHLSKWDIPYKTGYAQTGIVATIEGELAPSSKVIGLRADMDALPIQETQDYPWKSIHDGFMHACGHDGHMSILLGAAAYLQAHRGDFAGVIKIIFQPAEEGIGGARKMIEDGLFEDHRMDAIYALHNWPDLPAGEMGICSGPIMAASNSFKIDITGRSCHAAFPDRGINAGTIASEVFVGLSKLFSSLSVNEPAVVSPTVIQAGVAKNVIPETATILGTIRTLSTGTFSSIKTHMQDITDRIVLAYGGSIQTTINTIGMVTVNDEAETRICIEAAREVLGTENVHADVACAMTAEDFGFMLNRVPGAYMWLGQGDKNNPDSAHNKSLHNAGYDFNDEVIAPGIALFAKIAELKMSP